MQAIFDNELLPTKIASALSGYTADYLARLARAQRVEGVQVGRAWFIRRDSLEAFIAEQVEHKQQLAFELAQQRKDEYQAARRSSHQHTTTMPVTVAQALLPNTQLSFVSVGAERTFSEALASFAKGIETTVLRGAVPAFSVAVLVLFASNYLAISAQSAFLLSKGESIMTTASTGMQFIMQDRVAGFSATAASIAATEASIHTQVLAEGQTSITSPVLARALPYVQGSADSLSPATFRAMTPAVSARAAATVSGLVAAAATTNAPSLVGMLNAVEEESVTTIHDPAAEGTALTAQVAQGYTSLQTLLPQTSVLIALSAHQALAMAEKGLVQTAKASLALSYAIPPRVVAAEIAVGNDTIAATHAAIGHYSDAVYAYTDASPQIPGVVIAVLYNTGTYVDAGASHALPTAFALSRQKAIEFASDSGYGAHMLAAVWSGALAPQAGAAAP